MKGSTTVAVAVCVVLAAANGLAQKRSQRPPAIVAQDLVTRFLASHSDEVAAVELALISGRTCKTVAATHVEDIGERCDADERTAMRSGRPYVEAPTSDDPIYDVTQALHDTSGKLIGAVGMDLKPQPGDSRDSVVVRARELLRQLEEQIVSPSQLLEPIARDRQ